MFYYVLSFEETFCDQIKLDRGKCRVRAGQKLSSDPNATTNNNIRSSDDTEAVSNVLNLKFNKDTSTFRMLTYVA